jgi:type IV pilus assembly protein PilE
MKQYGFTLIELIATLTIISIVASLSYPIYIQHIIKTRRLHAEVSLLDLASSMERFYALHHSYIGTPILQEHNPNYQIKIASANASYYLLQAIPQNSQKQDRCGVLGFDAKGEKFFSKNDQANNCW